MKEFALPSGQEVKALREETITRLKSQAPYFALLNGEPVLRSNIDKFCPWAWSSLSVLLKEGKVIEQPMLFPEREGDSMLFKV